MTDVLVITGLSGAGRSQAADDLEDLGWFVVDNLPIELLDKIVELGSGPGSFSRLGLVVGPTAEPAAAPRLGRLHRPAEHRQQRLRAAAVDDASAFAQHGDQQRV